MQLKRYIWRIMWNVVVEITMTMNTYIADCVIWWWIELFIGEDRSEDEELPCLSLRLCIAPRSGEYGYSTGLHISNPL